MKAATGLSSWRVGHGIDAVPEPGEIARVTPLFGVGELSLGLRRSLTISRVPTLRVGTRDKAIVAARQGAATENDRELLCRGRRTTLNSAMPKAVEHLRLPPEFEEGVGVGPISNAGRDAQKSGPCVRGARRHYTGESPAKETPRTVGRGNDGRGGSIDFWGRTFAIAPAGVRINPWCGRPGPGERHLEKIGFKNGSRRAFSFPRPRILRVETAAIALAILLG